MKARDTLDFAADFLESTDLIDLLLRECNARAYLSRAREGVSLAFISCTLSCSSSAGFSS